MSVGAQSCELLLPVLGQCHLKLRNIRHFSLCVRVSMTPVRVCSTDSVGLCVAVMCANEDCMINRSLVLLRWNELGDFKTYCIFICI